MEIRKIHYKRRSLLLHWASPLSSTTVCTVSSTSHRLTFQRQLNSQLIGPHRTLQTANCPSPLPLARSPRPSRLDLHEVPCTHPLPASLPPRRPPLLAETRRPTPTCSRAAVEARSGRQQPPREMLRELTEGNPEAAEACGEAPLSEARVKNQDEGLS